MRHVLRPSFDRLVRRVGVVLLDTETNTLYYKQDAQGGFALIVK